MIRLIDFLECWVRVFAITIAWVALPAITVLGIVRVVYRNAGLGFAADALELQAALFFALIMTSFAYGTVAEAHVRIDILSERWPPRVRHALEIIAAITVVAPLCGVLIWYGVDSTWRSFVHAERIADTEWALQWVVRASLPVAFALLLVATLATVLRRLIAWQEEGGLRTIDSPLDRKPDVQ